MRLEDLPPKFSNFFGVIHLDFAYTQLFAHILEYLRDCRRGQEYAVPVLKDHQLVMLKKEALVYGLTGLAQVMELASKGGWVVGLSRPAAPRGKPPKITRSNPLHASLGVPPGRLHSTAEA